MLVQAGDFGSDAPRALDVASLSLPLQPAVRRKLGLDAYFGWLSDLLEQSADAMESGLHAAPQLRSCLQLSDADAGELYTNTDVDLLVLNKCCEQLMAAGAALGRTPLSAAALQRLEAAEFDLVARAGILPQVLTDNNAVSI